MNEPPVAVISGLERQYASGGTPKVFDGANSYDPDGGNITAWSWYIDGGDATPSSWYSEQSPSMTTTFRTGGHYAYVYLWVKDDEGTWSTSDVCYVHIVDLDADVDRSGVINVDDEDDEDMSTGHALVLPNCDDDNNDGIPDNWPGDNNIYTPPGFDNGDWDLDETYEPATEGPNTEVDNTADIADLAELWFHQMQFRVLPSFKIRLEVTKPSQHSLFSNLQSKDIIRIFLPNQQQNGDWVVTAGAEAVIGPENGATAEFTYQNGLLSMFGEGYNKVKFRVEGIELGALVDITLKFYENDVVQGSDKVRMRVAPYALRNHTMGVSSSGKTVYVASNVYGQSNYDLRTKLAGKYFDHLDATCPGDNDPWQQDGYEVGYVEAPYGDTMPVFLVLPRAYRSGSGNDLAEYVHNVRLSAGRGVCWRLEGVVTGDTKYNYGGNIECKLNGKLFYGTELHDDIYGFFGAQGTNFNPSSITTDWLTVGHVDEIVSFAPSGGYTIVADPDVCWGLLLWADSDQYPSTTATLNNHNIWFDILTSADSHMYLFNVDPSPPQDWKVDNEGIMEPQNLPTSLGSWSPPESDPQAGANNTGSGTLTRGGVFVQKLPAGINTRTYWIRFDQGDNVHYSVRFKNDSGDYGDPDTNVYGMYYDNGWQRGTGASFARTDADCIFKTAKCFILEAWWDREYRDQIEPGDEFFFTVNANSTTIEMPVLFQQKFRDPAKPKERFAVAYTIDHVNCLVDGSTVFAGDPDESPEGVITDYVERLFDKANYNNLNFAESYWYNYYDGDIHCGTNVIRD